MIGLPLRPLAAAVLLPLLLSSSLPTALAATREIWYDITYSYDANPDGLGARRAIGVNGTWPPPPIEINEEDTLIVHARNSLGNVDSSIHHHGFFYNSSSWNDGAVGVTQCGIPPGQTFDYHVNEGVKQYGTYWWHSHYKGQYVDGLRAPLIVHRTQERYAYDAEYTVSLYDWYHDNHEDLMKQFIAESNPTGAEPVPNSGVMQFSQNEVYLPGFTENATLPLEPGKTYRLRLINMSALAMFAFWIDGHDMRVIEVDGTDVEEQPIDLVTLSVAQRVSVLITTPNVTTSNYLIHANMNPDMFDVVPDDLALNLTSTIVYGASYSTEPGTEVDQYTEFPDQTLVPLDVEAQAEADVKYELGVWFDTATDGTNRAFFNILGGDAGNITYRTPTVPAYLTALTMGEDAANPAVYGQTNSMVLRHGQNVELTIINWDAGFHPFHLHGHKFHLISESYDVSSDDRSINPVTPEGLPNPMRRDTVMVPPEGGSRTLRFRADNPGTWIMHCHIEWHLESGLAAVFIEAPDVMQDIIGAPTIVEDQCRALGFATSGNAAGLNSTTDFTGLAVGPYPQQLGWHAKGIGALAGCILTALLGLVTVIWYALGDTLDEDELQAEVEDEVAKKAAKGSKAQRVRKLFRPSV